jgi:hypothetical protein
MSPCFLRFRGGKKKGSATTLCDSIQEDTVEITSRHHAWKVEYSSKPEGVGNSRTARTGFMIAAKEPLWKGSPIATAEARGVQAVCICGTHGKVKML